MLRTLALPVLALAGIAGALNLVPTPPKQPPKFEGSASSRRRVMGASNVMPTGHSMQTKKTPPLQAYTISEPGNKDSDWFVHMPKWEDFFLPKSAGHGEKWTCIVSTNSVIYITQLAELCLRFSLFAGGRSRNSR